VGEEKIFKHRRTVNAKWQEMGRGAKPTKKKGRPLKGKAKGAPSKQELTAELGVLLRGKDGCSPGGGRTRKCQAGTRKGTGGKRE